MRDFFHADTSVFPRRLRTVVIAVLVPLGAVCIFCAANILFNLRAEGDKGFAQLMVYIIAGCVAAGMLTVFSGAYITEKKVRRHARYTYFDILPKGMIFSVYAGEHYLYGERTIYRRLYYIPFDKFEQAVRDPKLSPTELTIKGEVRSYFMGSDLLGYHINEDGELLFDRPELNERHFDTLPAVKISSYFGSTKALARSIEHYFEAYKSIPEKKPFNIADYIMARPKRHTGTSNPLLDAPSYNRNWH